MKLGEISINELSEKDKDEILEEIIDDCILYAGDSYENFARSVTKMLVRNKIVSYGD